MLKLKDIEKDILKKRPGGCWRSDNEQKLYVKSCVVGDNFYDYREDPPGNFDWSDFPKLENDPRIVLVKCEDCCGCAGW